MTKSKSKKAAPEQQQEPTTPKTLKKDIRKDLRVTFTQKGSIDKDDMISKYLKIYPSRAEQIRNVVMK